MQIIPQGILTHILKTAQVKTPVFMKIPAQIYKTVLTLAGVIEGVDFCQCFCIKNPIYQFIFIFKMIIKSISADIAVLNYILYGNLG